jgi:hypothetical protein
MTNSLHFGEYDIRGNLSARQSRQHAVPRSARRPRARTSHARLVASPAGGRVGQREGCDGLADAEERWVTEGLSDFNCKRGQTPLQLRDCSASVL